MKTEFIRAIQQVCAERGLTVEVVLGAVEQALASAYKRDFGPTQNILAKIDPSTGEVSVFTAKEVVEIVEDPSGEMSLADARKIEADSKLGDTIFVETTPPNFGRIAAQTAKQVILQRIREAERDALYETYVEQEGEIVNGTVQSIDAKGVTIGLGRAEALLPRSQQVPNERHHVKQKLRVLILEVNRTNRGPEIIASRSHPDMLRRLLELEVPEIYNGLVEIRAIAREAGFRSKVAVAARQDGIDPVGACVGMRGVRIQSIVSELNGEKIDVIEWSPDAKEFISKSLSPARPLNAELSEHEEIGRTATVVVPDRQLSLAIGREGQNARLAAKLTGWRIDIISATEAAERALRRAAEEAARAAARAEISEEMPLDKLGMSKRIINPLAKAGLTELGQLLDKMEEDELSLLDIKGFGQKSMQDLKQVLEHREVYEILGREVKAPLEPEAEAVAAADEVEAPAEEAVAPVEEAAAPAEELVAPADEQVMPAAEEVAVPAEAPEEAAAEPVAEELPALAQPEELERVPSAEGEEVSEGRPEKEEEPYYDEERPSKKKRHRTLVYDEALGEVVAKKIRKPGRRREEWERDIEDWKGVTGEQEAPTDAEE